VLGKRVPVATDTHAIIEALLDYNNGKVFSMWFVPRCYKQESLKQQVNDRPDLSSERAPHMDRTVTFNEKQISGHEPQTGLDTKTD
jgi:hypothetical protein